jgi:8-hydroxy-5-deazaflavin:NADPH oxidoreductase
MKIGIIGAGNLGAALGKRLAAAGYDIAISFARTEEKVAEAAAAIGKGARPVSVATAIADAEIVILATPWPVTTELVEQHAEALDGKILWDSTNPLLPDMSGLSLGTTTSAGEEVARAAPLARVVKAIAPFAELLASDATTIDGRKPGAFVCADDSVARATIAHVMQSVNIDALEAGPLRNARMTEPLGLLLVQLAYVEGMGSSISTVLVH